MLRRISFAPGDSAMTGFSGTVLALPSLPPGVAPIDKMVIAVDAPSLSVFDLSTLGGAPQGRAISPTVKLSVKAKDIGQVFPLAFDSGKDGGPPNLYAARPPPLACRSCRPSRMPTEVLSASKSAGPTRSS